MSIHSGCSGGLGRGGWPGPLLTAGGSTEARGGWLCRRTSGVCAAHQVTARKRARPQAGAGGAGEPSRSSELGRGGWRQTPTVPGERVPGPAREQRAAGRSRGCWDACAVPGPSPSPAPYPRPCPPRQAWEKKEDGPVVCGGSAGGVRLHPDRRPGRDHKDWRTDRGGYYPGIIVSTGSLGAGLGAQIEFRVVLDTHHPSPAEVEV